MKVTTPYILVIGGANIDILGKPHQQLIAEDSNPGAISLSFGGVGRNIAENLVRIGLNTKLITAYGKDYYGDLLFNYCQNIGIDMKHTLITNEYPTSTYLSVLNCDGNMHIAISDMEITNVITPRYLEGQTQVLEAADYIIVDTNLPQETLDFLLTRFKKARFILDTVSTHKALKVKDLLPYFYAMKPNQIEAEMLLGYSLFDDVTIKKALKHLYSLGISYPLISFGSQGVAYLSGEELILHKAKSVQAINANGAGDTFIAAMTYGLCKNYDMKTIVEFASAAASITLESEATISPNISLEEIYKKLEV
ncbi:MAG: kinase [Firmicutes bacterium HGW-Firmicutes-7]|nr:MAG: kinase [Firmicutes bacterium HGW-Firmicutes-7]